MSTPHRIDLVQRVAREHGDLLHTNTYESCGAFVQHVLEAFEREDPGNWGHVGKTAGEGQCRFADESTRVVGGHTLTGFSHDVIWHKPSNRQIDILGNASARSDPNPSIHGPASVVWHVIPPEHYRPNNPWLARVPIAPGTASSPEPEPRPEPGPETGSLPQPQPEPQSQPQPQPEPVPAPAPCVVTVTGPDSLEVEHTEATVTLDVAATAPACAWVVLTSEAWLKAPGGGHGSGACLVTVEANAGTDSRSGEIGVHAGGELVHRTIVMQAGQPSPPPPRPWWHNLVTVVLGRRE
jgi:hypothetical protein